MDLDDIAPKKQDAPIDALEREELDSHSVDELAERKRRLEREITRTEEMLKSKEASKSAAESFFRS